MYRTATKSRLVENDPNVFFSSEIFAPLTTAYNLSGNYPSKWKPFKTIALTADRVNIHMY